jgi:hypothetical protein
MEGNRVKAGVSKAKLERTILAHLGFQARVLGHRLGWSQLVEASGVADGRPQAPEGLPAGEYPCRCVVE